MAFHFNFNLIKKHPYASAGVIVVGGLVLYLLLHGSSGASSSGSADPKAIITSQTNAKLAVQQDAEQAQYQMAALQAMSTYLSAVTSLDQRRAEYNKQTGNK